MKLSETETWSKILITIISMKKSIYIFSLIIISILTGCKEPPIPIKFEDVADYTIFDYLLENEDDFSSFIAISKSGSMQHTLSAYNPYGDGYTLFVPDNDAIERFIEENSQFSSLDELLADQVYSNAFVKYHVVNMSVKSNEFPFGAFSKQTLSGDYLTVSFIIETDTSYYKINNESAVIKPNIEVSNGFVHQIESALTPVTLTSYQWLEANQEYSIFLDAVNLTGLGPLIDFNLKDDESILAVTILAEPDSIYQKSGINSIEDLIEDISPDNSEYTSESNALYNFVAYHFLTGNFFIDDFVDVSTLYTTHSDIPLNIDGRGLDVMINKGKQIFDTIVFQSDTSFLDYITFKYDHSNLLTQSGVIHIIDQVMRQKIPSRAIRTFQFFEEPIFNDYRNKGGSFLIDDHDALNSIEWAGADLFFVDAGTESNAWNNDYLEIVGDFSIFYTIPKMIQGLYEVTFRAEEFSRDNALVEVFIDGKKIGGLIDLSIGGSSNSPFQTIVLGNVNFTRYSEHVIEVRPLIPGRFLWDFIRFEPV